MDQGVRSLARAARPLRPRAGSRCQGSGLGVSSVFVSAVRGVEAAGRAGPVENGRVRRGVGLHFGLSGS